MGAWGPRSFDDDIAQDWLEDLFDSDPYAFLGHCFDLSDQADPSYIACIGVVCSAEILHALLREPRAGLPESAHQWLHQNSELEVARFLPEAILGLGRVLGSGSEMREMWEDNEEGFAAWHAELVDLRQRLQAVLAESPLRP